MQNILVAVVVYFKRLDAHKEHHRLICQSAKIYIYIYPQVGINTEQMKSDIFYFAIILTLLLFQHCKNKNKISRH